MKRAKPSGDKWSNYTSAKDLGLAADEGEAQTSSYEIEQMVRGRTTKVGEWEEVVVPSPSAAAEEADGGEKRKAEEMDPEDLREFKLQTKKHADPYDDDDWDPASLTALKVKSKERKIGEKAPEVKAEQNGEAGAATAAAGSGWARAGDVETEPPEGVKAEPAEPAAAEGVKQEPGVKTEAAAAEPAAAAAPAEAPPPAAAGGSLFKKRRPPPSSRKK